MQVPRATNPLPRGNNRPWARPPGGPPPPLLLPPLRTAHQLRLDIESELGLDKLCQHNFEQNRLLKEKKILLAKYGNILATKSKI